MASLDEVRKYQARTRAKEYRLRKQNASQESINRVSPRKPWAEVKAMTPRQRSSYIKQLDTFNKKSRYVGSESGDVIPKILITRAKRAIVAHNKFVAKETKRIAGIAPGLWAEYRAKQRGILAHQESIGGLLTPIPTANLNPPRSLAVAKRRAQKYEERNRHDFAYYRKKQKQNMMVMLEKLGQYDLSELVRNMRADQFDVASSIMPVWENLTVKYAQVEGYEEENFSDIRSYLYKAWEIGAGRTYDETSEVRLDANRSKREKAAISRLRRALK